jgi:ABC-type glycerol-3-phosphate transport system permease component
MLLVIILIVQSTPIVWLFNTAIRPEHGFLDFQFSEGITFDNFHSLLTTTGFLRWLTNSFVIATASAFIASALANIFCLGIRFETNPNFRRLRDGVFLAYLFPAMFLVLPIQWIMVRSSIDLFSILVLPIIYQVFLFPIAIWIVSAYVDRIPDGAVQMARLDDIALFDRIRLLQIPYARPGFWISFAIAFVMALQEFVYAFILLTRPQSQTLTVGIAGMQAGDIYQWAVIAAAGVAVVLLVILMLFCLRVAVKSAITRLAMPPR